MKDRKIRTDKNLHEIIENIRKACAIETISGTIRLSIDICNLHYISECGTKEYSNFTDNIKNMVKHFFDRKEIEISFRISDDLLEKAKNIYQTKNPKDKTGITFAISCCLTEFYKRILSAMNNLPPSSNSEPLKDKECLFHRPGLKTKSILKKILNSIEDLCKKYDCDTFIEPFAGASNVTLHLETDKRDIKFKKIYLNDAEYDIINLLSVIQKHIDIFIILLLCFPENQDIFKSLNKDLKNKVNNPKIGEDIVRSVKFYYHINRLSKRKKKTYNSDAAKFPRKHDLINLKKISKMLEGAIITQNDVFVFLERLLNQKGSLSKTIIYLDPPYIGTEKYYIVFDLKDDKFHEKLRDSIIKLRSRKAKIILSYRATVTRKNKMTSEEVQEKLNKLYMKKGFFIQFVNVPHTSKIDGINEPDDQIEILLTSEQVSGSIPYDSNIADLIKKYVK